MRNRCVSLFGVAAMLMIGAGASAQDAVVESVAPTPQTIGTSNQELVYTPVTPCRIINTLALGGPIAAGGTRSFRVTGTNFSAQGGSAGSCNVPIGATGAVINFVAVNAAGAGDLRYTPYGTAMPLASFLNYVNSGIPNDNTANGMTFPICNPATTTCTFDFTIQADASATDIVADVQGYFQRPTDVVTVIYNNSGPGPVDPDLSPKVCQTADFTPTFNERAVLNGSVCLKNAAAGAMDFYMVPVFSSDSGVTWSFTNAINFMRAGDIDSGQWSCATHFASKDLVAGTKYRFGLEVGRDSGTVDASDSRCVTMVQRFAR